MKKKLQVEAEGGELILKNKAGDYVIIPKKYRLEVEDMIKDGCNGCIDALVETLPVSEEYAADGTLIPSDPKQVKIKQGNTVKTLSTSSKEYKELYPRVMAYDKERDQYIAGQMPEVTVTATQDYYQTFRKGYLKRNPNSDNTKINQSFVKRILDEPDKIQYTPEEQAIVEQYASKEDKRYYDYLGQQMEWVKLKSEIGSDKEILQAVFDPSYLKDIGIGTATDQAQYFSELIYKNPRFRKFIQNPTLKKKLNKALAFARKVPVVPYAKAAYSLVMEGRPLTAASNFIKIPEMVGYMSDALVNATQSNPGNVDIGKIEDLEMPYARLMALNTPESLVNDIPMYFRFAGEAAMYNAKQKALGSNLRMYKDVKNYGRLFQKEFPGTTHNDFVTFLENYEPGRNKSYQESIEAYRKLRKLMAENIIPEEETPQPTVKPLPNKPIPLQVPKSTPPKKK